jgi:hypothetical protein
MANDAPFAVQLPSYLTLPVQQGLALELKRWEARQDVNYYSSQRQQELLQGDLWTKVEIVNYETGARKPVKAIVLSNSCDIDETNKRDLPPLVTVAPLIPLVKYEALLTGMGINPFRVASQLLNVRRNAVTDIFYLPTGSALEQEHIALLSDVCTVPVAKFSSGGAAVKVTSLSLVGFYLFLFKLSVHFCRFHENVDRDGTGAK